MPFYIDFTAHSTAPSTAQGFNGISKLPKVAIVKTAVFGKKGGTLKLLKMAILRQQFLYKNCCINLPFSGDLKIAKIGN